MDNLHFRILFFGHSACDLWRWRSSAANPQRDCHDGKVDCHQHSAGKISSDTDEAVCLHEQVEEEALVKVLKQIVQASKYALYASAHRHFVLPAVANGLQSNSVDMIRNETAVWPRGVAQALTDHASQHCLQPLLIAVIMLPHALEGNANTQLPAGNGDCSIEQIKVWQLTIDPVVDNVQRLETMVEGIIDNHHALQCAAFQR